MTTLSTLLKRLKKYYVDKLEVRYVHPSLYVVCVDDEFGQFEPEERKKQTARKIQLPVEDLDAVIAHGILQLVLVTSKERVQEYSFLDAADSGQHWLSWYSRLTVPQSTTAVKPPSTKSNAARALHFYGFKGGQARSTILILLAKALADDGLRVLVVDADVEAPSLDTLFEVAAQETSATLMGLCGWSSEISPIPRVYVGRTSLGTIDLLACRPKSEDFDMDFAGFLLGATLDARVLQSAADSLRDFANEPVGDTTRYDVVLFDHRTGLAPSVLPIMEGWPGPAVIFVRPDGMSRYLESHGVLRALLNYDTNSPGAFVTFSLDPKETTETALERHGQFVEELLEVLSDALTSAAGPGTNDIDPTELERYWVLWQHDSSLLKDSAPSPSQLSHANQSALNQIREVLGFQFLEQRSSENQDIHLTKSGATDQGTFILTPDIARVFSLESNIRYIFGRKGTGKTRLLRELFQRQLGEPLLVAQDFTDAGIQSGNPSFSALMTACRGNFELFWWALLYSGLTIPSSSTATLGDKVKEVAALSYEDLEKLASPSTIDKFLPAISSTKRRVFLIDGVETAVPAAKLREFVESLFRFLATVQYTNNISSLVTIRLFLRSDLQKSASQNIEQQIEGAALHLRWDRPSILNFAVARIASLNWFRMNFGDVCAKIDQKILIVTRGGLSEAEAEELLLEIFPKDLERNKLKTTTFFAVYFSDAGGDSEAKASFYPRLFDGFLREMDNAGSRNGSGLAIKDGRLNSPFVLKAYDVASAAFIDEVRTELHSLLDLAPPSGQNAEAVNKLLDAFSGLRTPFVVEQMIVELVKRSDLPNDRVRDALGKMKQLGIFEDRPGYPGSWRTGRLYKSGLNMKYVRG